MLLAEAGFEVTVLEREPQVGGRTSTLELDGFRFDRGPTFFLFPEVLESIFRMCGRDLHDEVQLERLDPNYRLVFEGDAAVDVSSDLGKLKSEIAKLCAGGCGRRRPLSRGQPQEARALPARARSAVRPPHRRSEAAAARAVAAAAAVGERGSGPRSAISRIRARGSRSRSRASTSACRRSSARACSRSWRSSSTSSAYSTRAAAAAPCRRRWRASPSEMGVQIRLGEPVRELVFEGKRVRRVLTDRGDYRTDAIVINADFAAAMRDARAEPAAQSLARREDRAQQDVVLDLHVVSRHRRRVARLAASHDPAVAAAIASTCIRSSTRTCCRKRRRSTCTTRAASIRRWRRRVIAACTCSCP